MSEGNAVREFALDLHKTVWQMRWSQSFKDHNFQQIRTDDDIKQIYSIVCPELFTLEELDQISSIHKQNQNELNRIFNTHIMNYKEYYQHLNSQYGFSIDSPSFEFETLDDPCKIQFMSNQKMLISGNFSHVEFLSNLLNSQLPSSASTNIAKHMNKLRLLNYVIPQFFLSYTELSFRPGIDILDLLREKFKTNLTSIHQIAEISGNFIKFIGIDTINLYYVMNPSMFIRIVEDKVLFIDLYPQKIMTKREFYDYYGDIIGSVVLAGHG